MLNLHFTVCNVIAIVLVSLDTSVIQILLIREEKSTPKCLLMIILRVMKESSRRGSLD